MSDLAVSFDAPAPPPARAPRTAPVLLWVLAGLSALASLAGLWSVVSRPHLGPLGNVDMIDDIAHVVADLVVAVALVLLARQVSRGSTRARYAAFGVAGYYVIAAFDATIGLPGLLGTVGTVLWSPAYLLPVIAGWLFGSLLQAALALFLFRALARPAPG